MVLDHLNAAAEAHGLWYPVDVSTSAQATLGGMAGNNSLRLAQHRLRQHGAQRGRRDAWLADGSAAGFGRGRPRQRPRARIADFVRDLAERSAPRSTRAGRTVLRRVAGYNLDIFHPQSERPYTPTAASTWRTCWWARRHAGASRRA
jgi:hypothetical protein